MILLQTIRRRRRRRSILCKFPAGKTKTRVVVPRRRKEEEEEEEEEEPAALFADEEVLENLPELGLPPPDACIMLSLPCKASSHKLKTAASPSPKGSKAPKPSLP